MNSPYICQEGKDGYIEFKVPGLVNQTQLKEGKDYIDLRCLV